MNNYNKKRGFTIIEILVGVSLFVLIMGALGLLSRNVWLYNSFVTSGLNSIDQIRFAFKSITYEIRTAAIAETGAYVINEATSTSFTFFSDVDGDQLKDKVKYFLLNGKLQKSVIKPTGSPLTYNLANEIITTVIPQVTNASIFDYYDKNYDGTTAPLSSPVNIAAIRLVKITVNIDPDPNRAPTTSIFTTQVSIRNLKDNL